jgi:hypothetical protein
MTKAQKIQQVKASMPNASEAQVKEMVKQVNWLTKWDDVLKTMRIQYKADTGDNISQIEFNISIYETARNLPSQFTKTLIQNN